MCVLSAVFVSEDVWTSNGSGTMSLGGFECSGASNGSDQEQGHLLLRLLCQVSYERDAHCI